MSHEYHDHTSHYYKIYWALVGAFAISVAGTFTPWFWVTMIVAFGVATVKAYLVIKHFMHLNTEKPFTWYILGTALAFMVLFFAAVSPDVMNHEGSRGAKFLNGPRWENVAANEETKRREADHLANPEGHHGGHEASPEHDAGAEPAAPGEHPPAEPSAPPEQSPAPGHP